MKRINVKKLKKNKAGIIIRSNSNRYVVSVFKSIKYDYLSLQEPTTNNTIFSISSKNSKGTNRMQKAEDLGKQMGIYLIDKKIKSIAFNRSGYKYHGRIKSMADAMRKAGINF